MSSTLARSLQPKIIVVLPVFCELRCVSSYRLLFG